VGVTFRREHKLEIFGNQVHRSILDERWAKGQETVGSFIIRNSKSCIPSSIITTIKFKGIWAGHAERMGEMRNAYRFGWKT
jgi:hypothetical protein